ncbi:MAG: hypothetical protein HXY42_00050 [Chloroflexi bacterium]|nr:hypothetical protein [Chloroflexota bacterium]
MKKNMITLTAVMLILAACAPAPAPTVDPAEVQRQVKEAVALTVAAQSAQTEQALALIPPPTNTPLPTQTEAVPPSPTPELPTATPFVIVPSTQTPSVGGNTSSAPVVRDYACEVINQSPADYTYWKPNKAFDLKWTIVNTGTKAWPAGLDLKYFSGPSMATPTRVELPAMKPGDQFEVILDAVTPSTVGYHVMTWTIDGQICFPFLAINVYK